MSNEEIDCIDAADFFGTVRSLSDKKSHWGKAVREGTGENETPKTPLEWAYHLREHPEEIESYDFSGWSGLEWGILLQKQPDQISRCCLDSFSGEDWRHLLIVTGKFEDRCGAMDKWSLLSGDDWVILLSYRPGLSMYCDWQKAKLAAPRNVVDLLALYPEFAPNYDLTLLDGWSTGCLVSQQPKFAEKCDLGNLDDKRQWLSLLYYQPQFANQCNRVKFNIRQDEWNEVLNGKMPWPDVFSPGVNVYDAL